MRTVAPVHAATHLTGRWLLQPIVLVVAPFLLPQMKQLIDTVLPFDATTFNIAKLRSGAA